MITLTYPYTSPTTTLTLKSPSFGDKDRLAFNRVNRYTRSGTLEVFADVTWPKSETIAVQFDFLSQKNVEDLLNFMALSLGKEIGFLDWDARQWRGVVATPDLAITAVSESNFSTIVEFQGTLV